MDWFNAPLRMIRQDELLNALLAIWQTRDSLINQQGDDNLALAHRIGFEEGLDAVAQMAGLTDTFEAGKTAHRARMKAKLGARRNVIESSAR